MEKLERMLRKKDEQTTPIGSADDSRAERAAIGEDTEDGLAFLSPAQQPGELGRLGGYRILRVLGTGGMVLNVIMVMTNYHVFAIPIKHLWRTRVRSLFYSQRISKMARELI